MDLRDRLVRLEEQFWKGDADFYRRNLTDDSLMVLPEPVGVLTKDGTVESIGQGARWSDVRFEDVRVMTLDDDTALLTYAATARRDAGGEPYSTLASSAYVRAPDGWKLAFHQQTPRS
jgi:hypothetical protein